MTWFEKLVGFTENAADVRRHLTLDGPVLTSSANGRELTAGTLTTPTLGELRASRPDRDGPVTMREVVGDVQSLHADPANAGAFFQAASQFNLLEMPAPAVTPERGVTGYAHDHTQGPACAIACGAGTIVRNWFAPLDGQIGQTADRQIDCLADLAASLSQAVGIDELWEMRNGYALATGEGLDAIASHLATLDDDGVDALRSLLRIGIQAGTEVTVAPTGHLVTQAYCSAVPIGYSEHSAQRWEALARLVLDASYEATLSAAAVNADATGNNTVFLTTIGGGVFANPFGWIISAIERAVDLHAGADLDIVMVSYGSSNREVAAMVSGGTRRPG